MMRFPMALGVISNRNVYLETDKGGVEFEGCLCTKFRCVDNKNNKGGSKLL
jgi:hypothetical protein